MLPTSEVYCHQTNAYFVVVGYYLIDKEHYSVYHKINLKVCTTHTYINNCLLYTSDAADE